MSRAEGLTDSEVYWLNEETRLRRRVYELEHELRRAQLRLQEAEQRYRHPQEPVIIDQMVASSPFDIFDRGQGRGPRCKLCGWSVDEGGGSQLYYGVCALCRGLHGQDFARPRALIEAILEEPFQGLHAEIAAAEAWSAAMKRPVGIGQAVDAVAYLRATFNPCPTTAKSFATYRSERLETSEPGETIKARACGSAFAPTATLTT